MSKKRTLDNFFAPKPQPSKKPRLESSEPASNHSTYPFPIPQFPPHLIDGLGFVPATEAKAIDDQPDLDLLYFQPYIPKDIEKELFEFLRNELFFYRVKYRIKRFGVETWINTPRFTTVFGVDETTRFDGGEGGEKGELLVDAKTGRPVEKTRYKSSPRPIPGCLDRLRRITENTTGEKYNFCLVNYYADGKDSISYHSDDESFLGPDPAIASFSLGAKRDFLMKHKPVKNEEGKETPVGKLVKLPLGSGDMVLMRGRTQGCWLHSIPKSKGDGAGKGRINITFRRAMVRGGTDNYYRYNVGEGGVYVWDKVRKEMVERREAVKKGEVDDKDFEQAEVSEAVDGERVVKECQMRGI
ncbi:DNA repair family protein [Venturia nashicola]|uniref:DNA repair family protein n=1 Tax=Venturia nashicola TaxID=86259 RepID=A0A4Z1P6C6_9PEZI|nr:DNA repair family protein [Venturia nashicola]